MNKKLYYSILVFTLITCTTDGQDDFILVNEPGIPGKTQFTPVTAGSGGSVTPTSGTYNSGEQVTVTATPNSGYTFNNWSNGSTNNPLTLAVGSNTSLSQIIYSYSILYGCNYS